MTDPVATVLSAAGGALATLGALFGARFTARQSRAATDQATQVAAHDVNLREWQAILDEVRESQAATQAQLERALARIDSLEKDRASSTSYIEELREHIWLRKPPPPPAPPSFYDPRPTTDVPSHH